MYGASVSPSEKAYQTINDSPEAITFSWEATTTPLVVEDLTKPVSLIEIDSTKATAANLKVLEAALYGAADFSASSTYAVGDVVEYETKLYQCKTAISTAAAWDLTKWNKISDTAVPYLPLPEEVKTIMSAS